MANHGNRIRRYMDRFGVEEVEEFIDACLSIEDLIDIHSPFIKRYDEADKYEFKDNTDEEPPQQQTRFQAKSYMDAFVNPREKLLLEAEVRRKQQEKKQQHFPAEPMKDVMLFLIEHAPLKPWQADVLSIIRSEAYYFAPQGQTKIMNEGWASYWHSTIMTRHGLEPDDVINYADHCAGTLATSPTRLNPYKLGIELYRHIEDRWNRGAYGQDYDDCDDLVQKRKWNTHAGKGREKIFEVRKIHNDLTFIDEFLTLEFCKEHKLFKFGYNEYTENYEIQTRDFQEIKQQLLFSLTNMGRPIIVVKDGNYKNRGELLLHHKFSGPELKLSYAKDTLQNLFRLWKRPVSIETIIGENTTILRWDESCYSVDTKEKTAGKSK
jgi:stage V sporulation protein R